MWALRLTATAMQVAGAALLVWLPPLLMSRRSRATFAARAEHAATSRLDVEAVTSPPKPAWEPGTRQAPFPG